MCLAIPAQILDLDPATTTATVTLGGVRKAISTALLDEVAVGDYVLIHVGYALNRISAEEAAQTLALMDEMAAFAAALPEDAPIADRVAEPIADLAADQVTDREATR